MDTVNTNLPCRFFAIFTYPAGEKRVIPIKLTNPYFRVEKILKNEICCGKISLS
jgi:hypothetical protein